MVCNVQGSCDLSAILIRRQPQESPVYTGSQRVTEVHRRMGIYTLVLDPRPCYSKRVDKGDTMVTTWEVTGYYHGRKLVEDVRAGSQPEARRKFERLNPDYKAGAAHQV